MEGIHAGSNNFNFKHSTEVYTHILKGEQNFLLPFNEILVYFKISEKSN